MKIDFDVRRGMMKIKEGVKTERVYIVKNNKKRLYRKRHYDELGRMTYEKYPGVRERLYQYNNQNIRVLLKTKFPNGCEFLRIYNDHGSPICQKFPDGTVHFSDYKYDDHSRVTWKKNHKGEEYHYEYDGDGDVTRAIFPDGEKWYYEYDDHNNIISTKNTKGDGYRWIYKYDNNRMIYKKKYYMSGGKESICYEMFYEYDERGNIICSRDAHKNVKYIHEYEYIATE